MSWKTRYQKGSFRGVPFRTASHELSSGRRVVTHSLPGRDDPVTEDMGRTARNFTIECWVAGTDYYDERNALLDALEADGPGTLVHPWHGTQRVRVLDIVQGESTEEGGYAWFSVTYGEAGSEPVATPSTDTQAQARTVADAEKERAAEDFTNDFTLDGATAFVEDAADYLTTGLSVLSLAAAATSGGVGTALAAFDAGTRLLGIEGLARKPFALAKAVIGLVATISALSGDPRRRIAALVTVAHFGDSLESVPGETPARWRQRANQEAFSHLVSIAACAELVRVTADMTFASYEDAVATRDSLASLFDARAIAAADAVDDDRAASFDALRRVLVRDITTRGGTLARVYAHRMGATEPALVVGNRLYGAGRDLELQVADIVSRNRIRHPGFVPGGAEIDVLTGGTSNG